MTKTNSTQPADTTKAGERNANIGGTSSCQQLGYLNWRILGQYFRWFKIFNDDGSFIARGQTRQGRLASCYLYAAHHDFINLVNASTLATGKDAR